MTLLLKIALVLITLTSFTKSNKQPVPDCEKVSVSPRGQYVQIKCGDCNWVRIEYTTTDWKRKGNTYEKFGTVTWHDTVVDARDKGKIFYYRGAIGPASVSEITEANVLDCSCK